MKIISIVQTFILFSISFLLTGCSYINFYFLRNLSDSPIILKVVSESGHPISKSESDYILYSNNILKINTTTARKTNDTLRVEMQGTDVYYQIPPKSTVYISPLFWSSTSKPVKVTLNEKGNGANVETFDLGDISENERIKKKGGPFLNNILYYDYKNNTR